MNTRSSSKDFLKYAIGCVVRKGNPTRIWIEAHIAKHLIVSSGRELPCKSSKSKPGAKSRMFILMETASEKNTQPTFQYALTKHKTEMYSSTIAGASLNSRNTNIEWILLDKQHPNIIAPTLQLQTQFAVANGCLTNNAGSCLKNVAIAVACWRATRVYKYRIKHAWIM